jgi:uncharacterized protein DUF2877
MAMPIAAAVREPVQEIGSKAHAALHLSRGMTRPIPGFAGSGFVMAGGEIVWVGSRSHPMHPRAVIVEGARVGDSRVRNFDISGCRIWRSRPAIAPSRAVNLRASCRAFRAGLARIGRPRGFGLLLAGAELAFPFDLGAVHARAVATAYAIRDPGGVIEASVPLLGFGPGLTPSGDDFAGAAFFAGRYIALQEQEDIARWDAAASVLAVAAKCRSHAVSAALFADLASGESFGPLHDLAEALEDSRRPECAINAANALVRIGHSSGWDMLAGFLAGMTGSLADNP